MLKKTETEKGAFLSPCTLVILRYVIQIRLVKGIKNTWLIYVFIITCHLINKLRNQSQRKRERSKEYYNRFDIYRDEYKYLLQGQDRAERHDLKVSFSFFFYSSLFFKEGKRKGEKNNQIVIKSHDFLLNPGSKTRKPPALSLNFLAMLTVLFIFNLIDNNNVLLSM